MHEAQGSQGRQIGRLTKVSVQNPLRAPSLSLSLSLSPLSLSLSLSSLSLSLSLSLSPPFLSLSLLNIRERAFHVMPASSSQVGDNARPHFLFLSDFRYDFFGIVVITEYKHFVYHRSYLRLLTHFGRANC